MSNSVFFNTSVKLAIASTILYLASCKKPQDTTATQEENSSAPPRNLAQQGSSIGASEASRGSIEQRVSAGVIKLVPAQESNKGKLLFGGKAQVAINIELPENNISHPALRGESLNSLPVWQREKVKEVRVQLYKIYNDADQEAITLKDLSAHEQNQWMKEWNKQHRQELRALKAQERDALRPRNAPKPTKEEITQFQQKMLLAEPVFEETDILIIEEILPSAEVLYSINNMSESFQSLILTHQVLSGHFPQSVSRKNLKHIYTQLN